MVDEGSSEKEWLRRLAIEKNLAAPEVFRGRARSVATVAATAAGALAAGLVFSGYRLGVSDWTLGFGFAALALLLASVAFFVAASLYYETAPKGRRPAASGSGRTPELGTTKQSPSGVGTAPSSTSAADGSEDAAEELLQQIGARTKVGSVLGILAVASFLLMVASSHLFPATLLLTMEIKNGAAASSFVSCPDIGSPIKGWVYSADWVSDDAFLPVHLSEMECGGKGTGTVTVYIRRDDVLAASD